MANKITSCLKTMLNILLYMIAVVLLFVCVVFGIVFLVENSIDWANTNCYMDHNKEVICKIKE